MFGLVVYFSLGYRFKLLVIFEFNTTELQTNQTQFEDVMRMRMELRVRKFFTNVSDVQVRNIFWPNAFEDAVRNKESFNY